MQATKKNKKRKINFKKHYKSKRKMPSRSTTRDGSNNFFKKKSYKGVVAKKLKRKKKKKHLTTTEPWTLKVALRPISLPCLSSVCLALKNLHRAPPKLLECGHNLLAHTVRQTVSPKHFRLAAVHAVLYEKTLFGFLQL